MGEVEALLVQNYADTRRRLSANGIVPIQPPPKPRIVPKMKKIIHVVCEQELVAMSDVMSRRRTAPVVEAKHIIAYLARKMTVLSLPEIGRRMGGRDHTCIINGVRNITERRSDSYRLDAKLRRYEAILGEAP